ncbi:PIN domain-containing protein [Candidatus Electrothrix sp.]|uniref:PIN domain-containing protein n=1 Tax=Candidatus Electrothrix sp. TaxID=2170559 RepID=UPI0040565D24
MYLLDTNTLIYFFKDIGKVAETLLSKSPKDISIPSIALYELEVGIAKSNNPEKRKKQLEALTSRITVQSFTLREAKAAATIRADLEKQGTPIGPYDTLIAGMALSLHATLVTNNTKEFQRVVGLTLEDWF